MAAKYDAPTGAPPAYGAQQHSETDAGPAAPQAAYLASAGTQPSKPYGYAPDGGQYGQYPPNGSSYAPNGQYPPNNQYPPHQGYYGQQQQPSMGYVPQNGGYYGQQQMPVQGGYYGQQQMPMQGGYYGHPQQQRGSGSEGFLGACLGAMACCRCLDLLI